MNIEQARQRFVADSRRMLDDMEAALLDVDTGSTELPAATSGAILQIARHIKDAAGALSLHGIVSFIQVVEGVLDYVHQARIPLSEALVALLLECGDHLRRLMDAIDKGDQPGATDPGNDLIEQLRLHVKHGHRPIPARLPGPRQWHISFRCRRNMLRKGVDPLSIFHYLGTLGTIEDVMTITDAVPALDELDPQSCYLSFALTFSSLAGLAIIEDAFTRILDDDSLRIVSTQEPLIYAPSPQLPVKHAARQPSTIDGFQVTVGDTVFVIPMDTVDECVPFTAGASASYVAHRGKVLPVLRLRDHFGITDGAYASETLVIISRAGQRFGLVVDALLGDAQTAIKPMSTLLSAARGIAALSVLGNGDVALVLELDVLSAATRRVQPRNEGIAFCPLLKTRTP